MTAQNVLLIILDSCRLNYAESNMPNLKSLAELNLWFENAVAPSRWSLPSHASLVTGDYPSEHGICTPMQKHLSTPLVKQFSTNGYDTCCVSGNNYATGSYDFEPWFDIFHDTTKNGFMDGINVPAASQQLSAEGAESSQKYIGILRRALAHEYPGKSLFNVGLSVANMLGGRFERLPEIHPVFDENYSPFGYSGKKNTSYIVDFLTGTDDPFFLFSNYMDTHFPYAPPKRIQRELFGEPLSYRELYSLNETVAYPFDFARSVEDGSLRDEDLTAIRKLYTGEVRRVDEYLGQIFDTLRQTNRFDNTVVVVTADHGETLGEDDGRGFRRMGHIDSVSDHLLKVPLLIAHPDLDGRRVSQHVSIRNLAPFLSEATKLFERANPTAETIETLSTADGIAIAECPASKQPSAFDGYPELPDAHLERVAFTHTVVGYLDDWKVAVSSNDQQWAWRGGETESIEDVPQPLLDSCHSHLQKLTETEPLDGETSEELDVDDAIKSQLEGLGYI